VAVAEERGEREVSECTLEKCMYVSAYTVKVFNKFTIKGIKHEKAGRHKYC
jgi:hypothetical protein